MRWRLQSDPDPLLVQSSFDVNELLAALGVVTPATDPFTREPVKSLKPIRADILTDEFMEQNKWSECVPCVTVPKPRSHFGGRPLPFPLRAQLGQAQLEGPLPGQPVRPVSRGGGGYNVLVPRDWSVLWSHG